MSFRPRFVIAWLKQEVNKRLAWRQLKKLAELPLIKSAYAWVFLVPIIAKALSQIEDEFINLSLFGYDFSVPTQLPFSWTVLYFSGLCFLVSYILYLAGAPRLIKEHESFSSFMDHRKSYRHLVDYATEINTPFEIGFHQASLDRDGDKKEERDLVNLFWDLYEKADQINTLRRSLCALLLYTGLCLLGWLLLQNTYYVVQAA